ncbi:MAG: phosphoenolpyruvate--protein phosphotransferase [Rubricoccaceae bacterium]|nr:phosphoenolpyruvate--protein phosphotransferase [Rubricoccaceae bacterium]
MPQPIPPTESPEPIVAPMMAAQERVGGEVTVEGIGVAPGVAIGPAYVHAPGAFSAEPEVLDPGEVEAELARFERAIVRSERELKKIVTVAQEKLGGSSARIFDAQLLTLRDVGFYDAVVERIRERRHTAAYAVQSVMGAVRRRLETSGNAALRDRAGDLLDVQNRVLRNLHQGRAFSKIEKDRVVVAENLTAADVLLFARRGVLGCVLDFGGPTSHVSIMARALGVPAVVSLHDLADRVRKDDLVIVDGFSGRVVLNPSEATLATYRAKQARYQSLREEREGLVAEPAETIDGHAVALQANLEFREELPLLDEFGAEGIGLFRTEMLFLTQGKPLNEEEQYLVYREVVLRAAPHGVTFRLIDLGGDKILPMARRESNPFLGWRGIRILLSKPDLLRPQLRAVLRAAALGPARILIPMVSSLDEIRAVRALLEETAEALARDGIEHSTEVPVGVMVEVPAVALMAEHFAAEVDFFSVGTNDLTQYTLAVDRGNDLVAQSYRELHPAVLQLIQQAVDGARAAGIPVSLCGEMAADPRVTPLLVGLGLDALSASPAYLTLVKRALRAMTFEEAQALARRALRQPDADGVARLLRQWLTDHTPDLAVVLGVEAPDEEA